MEEQEEENGGRVSECDVDNRQSSTSSFSGASEGTAHGRKAVGDARMSMNMRKEKMREASLKPKMNAYQQAAAKVVESNWYSAGMGGVIMLNLMHSVSETDLRAAGHVPSFMKGFGMCFVFTYATDLCTRLYIYRAHFWFNQMNCFDGSLVAADGIMLILEGILGDVPSLSVLRGIRMLRIIRVIRNAVAFRELYLMLMGILSALRAIAFGTLLILITLVLWSMLAVELLQEDNLRLNEEGAHGDCIRCHKAFATVGDAMLTLTQSIIAGDSWGLIAIPLMETYPAAYCILIPAFISLQLGLMNVVAAVIVDRQAQARLEDDKLQYQIRTEELTHSYSKLKDLFATMDEDDSGCLTS